MAVVRWEPFRDLVSLQDRMNRLFDESYRGRNTADDDWSLGGSWAPAVDKLVLPKKEEAKPKQISISVSR